MFRNLRFALAVTAVSASAAIAQDCIIYDPEDYPGIPGEVIVDYITGFDTFDFFNSSGKRLTDANQVIRQDRANVHKFGKVGPHDNRDGYFTTPERREQITNADIVTWCHDGVGKPVSVPDMIFGGYFLFGIYLFHGVDGRLKLHVFPVG